MRQQRRSDCSHVASSTRRAQWWQHAACQVEEATRTIRDPREVARMKSRRLQEGKHAIIHRWTRQLHRVVHQRSAPSTIRMQEAARQIKPDGGELLTGLPY
jgi:hypothetical protein